MVKVVAGYRFWMSYDCNLTIGKARESLLSLPLQVTEAIDNISRVSGFPKQDL
ncbi:MAG: hypothetical protein KJ710_01135 [Candidatus Omnitrophica bacterium]|nr:hypothetical protein [Candidatus Omnitrophota bacterium]MBU1922854.1 hypothetical protein [Candidatus Omnitrophota bacterium]